MQYGAPLPYRYLWIYIPGFSCAGSDGGAADADLDRYFDRGGIYSSQHGEEAAPNLCAGVFGRGLRELGAVFSFRRVCRLQGDADGNAAGTAGADSAGEAFAPGAADSCSGVRAV